ncbi:Secreted beta-glucosidase sun1 [Ophiocordyceps camponoti-floridani]|uniref:Secreted beta-glucosidase sun1 n=1 Tax=Ophiocordyceps camponoti-floridani TaxID=2030778 RepID=A0A8H4QBL9_9HYPO|nr:Secreted beta-glucosidase sun1 [Ophiocordyceps camponoti-floridani]
MKGLAMRSLANFALAASMVAVAHARSHHHFHLHHRKNVASLVQRADSHPTAENSPVETVYQDMGGKSMTSDEAEKCLESGTCVVVRETIPQKQPEPASPPPPATHSLKAPDDGAKFIETKATYKPPPAAIYPPTTDGPAAHNKPEPESDNESGPSASGLNKQFPSGSIKCSQFPSDYGAVPLEWHDMGGWCGIQNVPGFGLSIASITRIATGKECSPDSMCSYACPPGYQKTQWPAAQGSNHESVGGLFCNKDGFLELTRPESKTLCEKGVGGVVVRNNLSEQVTLCRTDYPGTENMAIPTIAKPGVEVDLTNPDQNSYYQWAGKPTSAQYYLNLAGLGPEDACVWRNSKSTLSGKTGNWAPLNIGTGFDGTNTYISLFPNLPTSDCALDYDVSIEGDVVGGCSYTRFTTGSEMKRCTASLKPGGKAVVVIS